MRQNKKSIGYIVTVTEGTAFPGAAATGSADKGGVCSSTETAATAIEARYASAGAAA